MDTYTIVNEFKEGDVLEFFGPISRFWGIYVGNGMVVHSKKEFSRLKLSTVKLDKIEELSENKNVVAVKSRRSLINLVFKRRECADEIVTKALMSVNNQISLDSKGFVNYCCYGYRKNLFLLVLFVTFYTWLVYQTSLPELIGRFLDEHFHVIIGVNCGFVVFWSLIMIFLYRHYKLSGKRCVENSEKSDLPDKVSNVAQLQTLKKINRFLYVRQGSPDKMAIKALVNDYSLDTESPEPDISRVMIFLMVLAMGLLPLLITFYTNINPAIQVMIFIYISCKIYENFGKHCTESNKDDTQYLVLTAIDTFCADVQIVQEKGSFKKYRSSISIGSISKSSAWKQKGNISESNDSVVYFVEKDLQQEIHLTSDKMEDEPEKDKKQFNTLQLTNQPGESQKEGNDSPTSSANRKASQNVLVLNFLNQQKSKESDITLPVSYDTSKGHSATKIKVKKITNYYEETDLNSDKNKMELTQKVGLNLQVGRKSKENIETSIERPLSTVGKSVFHSVENADQQCGDREIQVSEGAEACLNEYHRKCIPIDAFSLSHLPYQHREKVLYDYIKVVGDLTVRVAIEMTSHHRPEFWPNTNFSYPFYDLRGRGNLRTGSGMMTDVAKFENGYDHVGCKHWKTYTKCWCKKYQHSDSWYEFTVMTATHVVFDDIEASHTSLRLFYDRENSPEVSVDQVSVEYANIQTDVCMLTCVTCDEFLGRKLERLCENFCRIKKILRDKYKKSRKEDNLTFTVSHPHGCPKQLTIDCGGNRFFMDNGI